MKTEPAEARIYIASYSCENGAGDMIIDREDADEAVNIAFKEGQSSPKIKQLEWMVGEGTETRLANIPFNNYYIIDGVDGMIFLTINIQYHIGRYATIDEAKAAAQADFAKKVMECLDIADNSNK